MEDGKPPPTHQERIAVIAFGILLAAFGVFWLVAATGIQNRNTYQSITPDFLPFWTGVALAVVGLLIAFTYWRRTPVEDPDMPPLFIAAEQVRVVLFVLVLLAYCLLLEEIHYFWLTFAVMTLALIIAREPFKPVLFLKSGATAAIMFVLFVWWFDVPLPGSRFF